MTAAAIIERLEQRGLMGHVRAVCERRSLTVADVFEHDPVTKKLTRFRPVVKCRHEIMHYLWVTRGWSFPFLGRLFGIDHTTVMSAVKSYVPDLGQPVNYPVPNCLVTGDGIGTDAGLPALDLLPDVGKPVLEVGLAGANPVDPSRALASRALSDQDLDPSQSSSLSGSSETESSCLLASLAAREGETNKTNNETAVITPISQTKKTRRRTPEHPLPADWTHEPDHAELARSRGVDVATEAAAFRAHAEAHARTAVRWGAAFRQWLLKAQPRRTAPLRTLVQRDGAATRLWKSEDF